MKKLVIFFILLLTTALSDNVETPEEAKQLGENTEYHSTMDENSKNKFIQQLQIHLHQIGKRRCTTMNQIMSI